MSKTIEIKKNERLEITDDLITSHLASSDIIFVLHEHSVLRYTLDLKKKVSDQPGEKKVTIKLVGEHADAKVRVSYKGFAEHNFKLTTVQHHMASFTKSDLLVKSALLRAATFSCDSMVMVEKKLIDAQP